MPFSEEYDGMDFWPKILTYGLIFVGAIVVFAFILCLFVFFYAAGRAKREKKATRNNILSMLPQKDCGECGFGTCADYADVAVSGTCDYVKCQNCSDGMNARISFLWTKRNG